jgi:hypothetical protein
MAIQNLKGSAAGVYSVVELNHVEAVKTGKIYSQYQLNATDFASKPAENGMLLAVDHVAGEAKLPAGITATGLVLHASVEKDYEGKGRKSFAVNRGEFLPRLFQLSVGDIFETNGVLFDDAVYANFAAIAAAVNGTTVYGIPDASGYVKLVAAPGGTEKVVLKAVKGVSLPNGQNGIKFVVSQYA